MIPSDPGKEDAGRLAALDDQLNKRFLVIEVDDESGEIYIDTSDGFSTIEMLGIAEFLKVEALTEEDDE